MESVQSLEGALKPSLPNELLEIIVEYVQDTSTLKVIMLLNTFSFTLLQQRVYRKVVFPSAENVGEKAIVAFFKRYGYSLKTVMFPDEVPVNRTIFDALNKYCPALSFIYSANEASIVTLRNFCQSTKVSFIAPLKYEERFIHLPQFYDTAHFYKRSDTSCMLFYREYKERIVVFARKQPTAYVGSKRRSCRRLILPLFQDDYHGNNCFDESDRDFLNNIGAIHIRWPRNKAPLNCMQVLSLAYHCEDVRVLLVPAITAAALQTVLEQWPSIVLIVISSLTTDEISGDVQANNTSAVESVKSHKRIHHIDKSATDYQSHCLIHLKPGA